MNHQYLGSNFDSFLEEEGMLAEVEAAAIKKLIALQVQTMMKSRQLSKSAMAKKMYTSPDPKNNSHFFRSYFRL